MSHWVWPSMGARFPASWVCGLAALALACAGPGAVTPEKITDRGRGYLRLREFSRAREAFAEALQARPGNSEALLGLAAAFEGLGRLDSAAATYGALTRETLPGRAQRVVRGRLRILARRHLQVAAREAIAAEGRIPTQSPSRNTLAVMAFRYLGADPRLKPLERGLAHVLITDLGQVPGLVLLERERIQALLDELRLAEVGRVDSTTAARSGRLLQAGRVLQGVLQDVPQRRLRLDAGIVDAGTADVVARGAAADELERLLNMEKVALFQLLDGMGIVLTPLERERLAERPTASLLAFLAFSRGLEAEDGGNFRRAGAEYREAVRLDPGFTQATERAAVAEAVQEAAGYSVVDMASLLSTLLTDFDFLADNLNQVMRSAMQAADQAQRPRGPGPPQARDPLGDVGGGDRMEPPAGQGALDILVRRPQ